MIASITFEPERESKPMKRVLSCILQFILLLLAFAFGSFAPALHILPSWQVAVGSNRFFVYDGLVFMLILYLLFLLIGLARKRLQTSWVTSTIALVLALSLGLAMKLGFMGS
jgi:hypothetical protein